MWPMLVVPNEERSEFHAKGSSAQWDHDPARSFILHRSDEAFNHGNAPMLPNGAEPWANSLAFAPAPKGGAPEDGVLVADQILGGRMIASGRLTDEGAYCK